MSADNGRTRLLLVEDDASLRQLLLDDLSEHGFTVDAVSDVGGARERLHKRHYPLVICDLRLPGESGMDLLRWTRELPEPPGVIVITAFGSIAEAVDALRAGAEDFLTKPVDLDHLLLSVQRVLRHHRLQQDVRHYRDLLRTGGFHGLVGNSAPMRALYERIRRVATASGAVLICGESGTGKELVARAVHAQSARADGPFVALNCAGIPHELLESELFGHVSGAFSGAQGGRRGLFSEADGGTLLLDEIGEMPWAMQAKLLRTLQDGKLRPVGANREQTTDVRVVAATNRDLPALIRDRQFREDLFYRLETFQLHVPPLRERADDLDVLATHLLQRAAAACGRSVPAIDTAAFERLRAYRYPGNVRELAGILEHAVTFCRDDRITVSDLPARLGERVQPSDADLSALFGHVGQRLPTLAEVERRYIAHVLEATGGNKQHAARVLGIGRRTLYRRS